MVSMINDDTKSELLRNIELVGSSDSDNASTSIVIANRSHLNLVTTKSSGTIKIIPRLVNQFQLTISCPQALRAMSPLDIRCCLCRKVITYPCWYYKVSYAVNAFHFFVCFDRNSSTKVNSKCFRRI